jgi:hypothetical protein
MHKSLAFIILTHRNTHQMNFRSDAVQKAFVVCSPGAGYQVGRAHPSYVLCIYVGRDCQWIGPLKDKLVQLGTPQQENTQFPSDVFVCHLFVLIRQHGTPTRADTTYFINLVFWLFWQHAWDGQKLLHGLSRDRYDISAAIIFVIWQ